MNYNNKNQAYTIVDKFRLKSNGEFIQYVRVKFTSTRHEQIVKLDLVKTGDFEDESLKEEESIVEKINRSAKGIYIKGDKIETNPTSNYTSTIIAIDPKGKEDEVLISELEEFCSDNKLDLEAVSLILEGKQKTHRKWSFKYKG